MQRSTKTPASGASAMAREAHGTSVWRALGLICLASVVVYGNTLGNQFVFDDYDVFVNRTEITSFTYVPEVLGLTTGDLSYRPVRLISYMGDYFFSGLDPLGYHVFNIFYHILAGLFVFLVTFRMGKNYWFSSLTSIIFVVHPIQTDSVTYLSGRRDILFSLFYLMSFYYFLKYRNTPSFRYAFYVNLYYVLGLFSKEMAVTLPAAAFCYDLLQRLDGPGYLKRIWRSAIEALRESRYLYVSLFTGAGVFTLYKTLISNPSTVEGYYGGTAAANFLTVAEILVHYVFLLFFPITLNADYSYNAFPVVSSPFELKALLSVAILIAILCLVLRAVKRNRTMAFAGLWFFITLLPTCHIFPHHELLAEHYLYLPLFGFALFSACVVESLLRAFPHLKTVILGSVVLLVLTYSIRTMNRNADWKDDLTLWEKTVQTAPNCARARGNYGKALMVDGKFEWAVSELNRALQIDPCFVTAFSNLGVAHAAMGRYDEAIMNFEKAIRFKPEFPEAYYNLGLTWAKKGDFSQARIAFEKALDLEPDLAPAHYNLGTIYRELGGLEKARHHFGRAMEIRPDSQGALQAQKAIEELGGG